MALKKSVKTVHGFDATGAYHRVESVSIVGKSSIHFVVRSSSTKDDLPFCENAFSCAYSIDGDNPIAQAYAHLKTVDAFKDAEDC